MLLKILLVFTWRKLHGILTWYFIWAYLLAYLTLIKIYSKYNTFYTMLGFITKLSSGFCSYNVNECRHFSTIKALKYCQPKAERPAHGPQNFAMRYLWGLNPTLGITDIDPSSQNRICWEVFGEDSVLMTFEVKNLKIYSERVARRIFLALTNSSTPNEYIHPTPVICVYSK